MTNSNDRDKCEENCDSISDDGSRSELTEDSGDVHPTHLNQQEQRHTQVQCVQSTLESSGVRSRSKKTECVKEDIVERNKITLGRLMYNDGSYLRAHALNREKPHTVKKVRTDQISCVLFVLLLRKAL